MPRITILLADDHPVVRQGLRTLLQAEPDFEVAGEAQTGRQAVVLTRSLRPDVVVMDIAMPQLNGLEATRQITRLVPACKVVVLSTYSDDEYLRQLLEAGASGYLVKQAAVSDLVRAIRDVQRGKTFFSPSISRRLIACYRQTLARGGPARPLPNALPRREAEVLQLIAEGCANKQIAAELSISIKTVEKHRQQLMKRLGIHDIAGLTRYAVAKGIVENVARGRPQVN